MPSLSTPATTVTLATLLKHLAFLQQFRDTDYRSLPVESLFGIAQSNVRKCLEFSRRSLKECGRPAHRVGIMWAGRPLSLRKKNADEGSPTFARGSTPHWLKCRK